MSTSWAGGSTRRWRKLRLFVLNRDRWICQLCEQPIDPTLDGRKHPRAPSVHHTRGKIHGDDPAFLVAAHRQCNLDVGDPNATPDPEPRPMTRW